MKTLSCLLLFATIAAAGFAQAEDIKCINQEKNIVLSSQTGANIYFNQYSVDFSLPDINTGDEGAELEVVANGLRKSESLGELALDGSLLSFQQDLLIRTKADQSKLVSDTFNCTVTE